VTLDVRAINSIKDALAAEWGLSLGCTRSGDSPAPEAGAAAEADVAPGDERPPMGGDDDDGSQFLRLQRGAPNAFSTMGN